MSDFIALPPEFSSTYRRYEETLRRYAQSLTHDRTSALDLLQEASVRMYEKRGLFSPGTNFKAWASKIIYNLFVSGYRRERRRRDLTYGKALQHTWAARSRTCNGGEALVLDSDFEEAVAALSPLLREALALRIAGLPYAEIGEELGVAVGTAKTRVFFARKSLRAWWRAQEHTRVP